MPIASEVRKLATDKLIELFILDTTPIGGGTLDYFHSGTSQVNAPIVFQGQTFQPWALECQGFDKSGTGALPQPTLTVGNPQGIMSRTVLQLKDLVGAKLLRKRTFAKFLDAVNFPVGRALLLNGATQVTLPSAPALNLVAGSWSITVSALVTTLGANAWNQILGGEGGAVSLGYSAGGVLGVTLTSLSDAPLSNYHQAGRVVNIGVTYNNDTKLLSYYINGALQRAVTWDYSGVVQANKHTNVIGNSGDYPANFNGGVWNVRIYDKALSALQVSAVFTAGSTFGPTVSYNCDETSGTLLHDNVGSLDGTLAAGASFGPQRYDNSTADPAAEFPIDVFYVIQKTREVPVEVEFKVATSIDLEGVQIPLRPLVQNACQSRYRSSECGWTGGNFDKNDQPSSQQLDQCGKRISSCKVRFGATAVLPFGGFPGARRYS